MFQGAKPNSFQIKVKISIHSVRANSQSILQFYVKGPVPNPFQTKKTKLLIDSKKLPQNNGTIPKSCEVKGKIHMISLDFLKFSRFL